MTATTKNVPNFVFRGDKRGNGTLAEMHKSDGIISRLVNGGDPAYVERNGLLESVRAHVRADTAAERIFQNKSSLISFSSQISVAVHYGSDGNPKGLRECESYEAFRYIFQLRLDKLRLSSFGEGIYLLTYDHAPDLEVSDSPFTTAILQEGFRSGRRRCEICDNEGVHRLLVISVVEFLEHYPSYRMGADALLNARQDHEWLIMPGDQYSSLHGQSAKICRSRVWEVGYFRMQSDPPVAPGMSDVLGQDDAE